MIKLITLLKRREGLNPVEFRDYYERHHRVIGEKYLKGRAVRYVRRYVDQIVGADEPDHDVVMETWFADEAAFAGTMTALMQAEAQAEIIADEEKLFDRSKHRSFTVIEAESDMR